MALNKYATIRYRVIDRCLRGKSHPYPSKEFLREACEIQLYGSSDGQHISMSTIEKDLWAMKNESSLGYAPIAYNKSRNGYYYTDPEFSLDLPLNEADIELIRMAAHTLRQFKDSQVFQDLEAAVSKIEGRLNVYHQITQPGHSQVIRFETAPSFAGSEHLASLLDAIQNRDELKLKYIPFADPTERSYIVHPYFLQEHKNRWYLICFETDGSIYRTLGLDRIESFAVTGRSFVIKEEFDPDTYYQYSFGIGIYDGKPEEITLSFEPVQGKYILSQPIHQSQEVMTENEAEVRIRLRLIISPEFIMHLLSYGPQVTVVSPAHLKEKIISYHRQALENYR